MFRPIKFSLVKLSKLNKLNSALLGVLLLTAPVLILNPLRGAAHEVEISGNIGGTLHIEPNDNPIAGGVSVAWFVLNRRGGQPIRLSDCNCSLAVYAQPRKPGDSPIQQPSLTAKAIEGRSGVPSANITFPRTGSYDLVLKGQPVTSGDFAAFELRFPVTVAQ